MHLVTRIGWVIVSLFFLGCATEPKVTPAINLGPNSIVTGMSQSQVVSKLGSPFTTDVTKDTDGISRIFSTYKEQQKRANDEYIYRELTVIYKDGKVEKTAFSERIILKPLKDVRMTHGTIELR
jgi:hypothetical protein